MVAISQGRSVVLSDTHLVTFQSVFTSEGLVARAVAWVGPFAVVRVLVALQIVLPAKRQRAHIALEWTLGRRGHRTIAGVSVVMARRRRRNRSPRALVESSQMRHVVCAVRGSER